MARSAEGLAAFVGDVLAEHYMRRFWDVDLNIKDASGQTARMMSRAPFAGFMLRADKPTRVVLQWDSPPRAPLALFASGAPCGGGARVDWSAPYVTPQPADGRQATIIAGARVAQLLQERDVPAQRVLLQALRSAAAGGATLLLPVASQLQAALERPEVTSDDAHRAQDLFNLSSILSSDSQAVDCMRSVTRALSQQQQPSAQSRSVTQDPSVQA